MQRGHQTFIDAKMVARAVVNIYPYDGNHIIMTADLVNDKSYPFKHKSKNGRRDKSEDLTWSRE
ncbi:MAG: hypothetical protein ACREBS_11185 [Nitrososphaerales archaeon]